MEEKYKTIWLKLAELADSAISWNDGTLDKEWFIEEAMKDFILLEKQK